MSTTRSEDSKKIYKLEALNMRFQGRFSNEKWFNSFDITAATSTASIAHSEEGQKNGAYSDRDSTYRDNSGCHSGGVLFQHR
jgi:hypothetical protein